MRRLISLFVKISIQKKVKPFSKEVLSEYFVNQILSGNKNLHQKIISNHIWRNKIRSFFVISEMFVKYFIFGKKIGILEALFFSFTFFYFVVGQTFEKFTIRLLLNCFSTWITIVIDLLVQECLKLKWYFFLEVFIFFLYMSSY